MKREPIEWCQFYWYDTPVKGLPRILLVGDSIVVGYSRLTAELLKGKAVAGFYATSKIVGDPFMLRELDLALGDYPIDLIYFNNGLHGLVYDDAFYQKGLEASIDYLRNKTKARLFWRNSTPITVMDKPEELEERNQIVLRRNNIAEKVMSEHGIPSDDLYSLLVDRPELSARDGFHYNKQGNEVLAEHIAAYLTQALSSL